uniref:Retroviral polymerase SH3-like domain-containing protein n=1 Tax=Chenopodium quinoa TaxID=63459 RepID=A0A803N009_CHEQI
MNPLPSCTSAGCTCTQVFLKQQHEERLVQFLMKLDIKFAAVRTNILMMQPLPTISMAYKLLVQEEKQRQASLVDEDSSSRSMAFTADCKKNYKNYSQGPRMTFQCNGNKPVVAGKRIFCDHCRFPGHTIDRCYKLNGYPPNFAKNKGKKVAAVVHMDDDANEQEEHVTHISTDQFNNILKALQSQDYKVFDKVPNTITVADGKHVLVEHIGTVMFDNGIVLQNVLHVPEGPTLSQSVVLGKLVSGLYVVDDKSITNQVWEQSQEVAVADDGINNKLEDAKLWHLRMGHMPFNKLHLIVSDFDEKIGKETLCQFASPYELLNGKKPDLSHLKVFGSLCYVSTLKMGRTKFDSRATPCVLVGYPPDQKAYRIFDLESKKMIISRDITFYEKHLPYHYETHNQNTKYPIFLPIHTSFDTDTEYTIPEPFQLETDNTHPEPNISTNIPQTIHISISQSQPKPNQPESQQPEICPVPVIQSADLRQSDRPRKRPSYLDSYICTAESVSNHWCNIVQFDVLPSPMKFLINKTAVISEPTSYLEASQNEGRSVTGYVLLLGKSPVSWKSKKQPTISKSSSETEYRAMAAASSETTWLVKLLTELCVLNLKPVALHCDNQSAIHIGKNPVFHECTKHIELDCHFTREKVLEGLIVLTYTPTAEQLADIMTKALSSFQHNKLKSKLGMYSDVDIVPSLRGDVSDDTAECATSDDE